MLQDETIEALAMMAIMVKNLNKAFPVKVGTQPIEGSDEWRVEWVCSKMSFTVVEGDQRKILKKMRTIEE